jgi:hypothetical protein
VSIIQRFERAQLTTYETTKILLPITSSLRLPYQCLPIGGMWVSDALAGGKGLGACKGVKVDLISLVVSNITDFHFT